MKQILFCLLLALPVWADVKVTRQQDRIDIEVDGKPFSTLYFGSDRLKPIMYPLRAADGTVMTRAWPMEQVEGESKDHPHHQGLWLGQRDVNELNYWENSKTGPNIGRVVVDPARPIKVKSGAKSGSIDAELLWQNPEGKLVLREHRVMTFYSDKENRVTDFDITLTAANGEVKFGDTKEGTFAIRLNDKLTEKQKGGVMTNAEGATTMKAVWGKPSPWVDYSGTLGGKPIGIAILNHPSSFRYPTRWHSRDYGLFAANPFAEKEMTTGKGTKDINFTLESGKSIRLRYRVIIHPGNTADAKIADLFKAYEKVK